MTNQQLMERTQKTILNDQFRKSGLGVVLTNGVQSVKDLDGLLEAIREYDDFDGDNDPWLEHDLGRIEWNGDKVFWKIDYYDEDLSQWEHPLCGSCNRVMTVMLANEY